MWSYVSPEAECRSHYALLSTQGREARPCFERLFREYGLPGAIRTDNGVPFATTGIHGLSQLNVWWMRLGIQHQRIRPASPQENGAHERMHRTLKREATRPAAANRHRQQVAFDRFRAEYNEDRPHEALADRTPASVYRRSRRVFPDRLPPIEYPGHFQVRFVCNAGTFRFQNRLLFIANALKQHHIGLDEIDDDVWSIYFYAPSFPISRPLAGLRISRIRIPKALRHRPAIPPLRPSRQEAHHSDASKARTAKAVAASDMNSLRQGSPLLPPCSRS